MQIRNVFAVLWKWVCVVLCLLCLYVPSADAGDHCTVLEGQNSKRVAIVVGNGAYPPGVGVLTNPVNDARAIARMLHELAFTVALVIDGTEDAIAKCIDRGLGMVERPEVGLFHFSGHGVQFDDRNFLIAVDADVSTKPMRGLIALQPIIEKLQSRADATLVFLDACRDNPFMPDGSVGLSVSTGRNIKPSAQSSKVDGDATSIAKGTLIAYATSPNIVALDGKGSFSPFSQAILETLPTPGYSVQRVMSKVTKSVGEATDWAQTPWIRSSLNKELKLFGDFSLDQVQAASRNWAEVALSLNEKGRRNDAVLAALKGLPDDPTVAQGKFFPEAVDALYRIVRSDRTWIDPKGSLFTLERSANGATIAVSIQTDAGIMVQVWDARTHKRLMEIPTGHVSYALDPSGERLAVSSPPGRITLWDISSGEKLSSFSGSPLPIAGQIKWSPNGSAIAVTNRSRVTLHAISVAGRSSELSPGKSVQVTGVEAAFGDDRSLCMVRKRGHGLSVGWVDVRHRRFTKVGDVAGHDTFIRIWCDRKSGSLGLVYTENIDDIRATAWLGDGQRVDVKLNGLHAMTLTVSPDQRWLALADNLGNITFYSAITGKLVASPSAKPGYNDGYGHVYYGLDGGPSSTPAHLVPPPEVWKKTLTGRPLIDFAVGLLDGEQQKQLKAERIAVNR